jgi:hypothetical protein
MVRNPSYANRQTIEFVYRHETILMGEILAQNKRMLLIRQLELGKI